MHAFCVGTIAEIWHAFNPSNLLCFTMCCNFKTQRILKWQATHGVAAPGARIILDDMAIGTHVAPGPLLAYKQIESIGLLKCAERYGTFPPGHHYNPCMRTPLVARRKNGALKRRPPICLHWGFAVCTYAESDMSSKDVDKVLQQKAPLTPYDILSGFSSI